MNRSDGHAATAEEATDQLVDEICQRLLALDELLDTSIVDTGLRRRDIRRHAADVVERLTDRPSNAAAVLITRTLWPLRPRADVPAWWWATPLGRLISAATKNAAATSDLDDSAGTAPDAQVGRRGPRPDARLSP